MSHDTYTIFDKKSCKVKGRLSVPKGTVLPDDNWYVRGFYSSEYFYDSRTRAPRLPEEPDLVAGGKIEGRAFGDNQSFEIISPYFTVNMWQRTA